LRYTGHTSPVTSLFLVKQGTPFPRVLSIADNEIIIWELLSGDLVRYFSMKPRALVVLYSINRAIVSKGNSIEVWDLVDEILVNSTLAHQDIVTSIKVSPSESKIISTSLDNTIKVWKVNGSDIRNLTTVLLDSTVESMNFFQSEKYFYAITKSNNFFLWNINGASQSKMRLQPPIIVNNYKSNQIEKR